jgi:hypothetical protein
MALKVGAIISRNTHRIRPLMSDAYLYKDGQTPVLLAKLPDLLGSPPDSGLDARRSDSMGDRGPCIQAREIDQLSSNHGRS